MFLLYISLYESFFKDKFIGLFTLWNELLHNRSVDHICGCIAEWLLFNPHNCWRMVSKFLPHLCSITIPGCGRCNSFVEDRLKVNLNYLEIICVYEHFSEYKIDFSILYKVKDICLNLVLDAAWQHFRYKKEEPGETRETARERLKLCIVLFLPWTGQ